MIYYILATLTLSSLTFMVYGLDKYKAIKHKRRISEKTLLTLAFGLGGLGAFIGMFVFRHKTNKLTFKLFNSLCVIMQLALGIYLYTLAL